MANQIELLRVIKNLVDKLLILFKWILREDGALSFSLNLFDEINTKTTKVAIYGIIVNI